MFLGFFPARAESERCPGVHSIWKTSEYLSGICGQDKGACPEVPPQGEEGAEGWEIAEPGWDIAEGTWPGVGSIPVPPTQPARGWGAEVGCQQGLVVNE